jgi:hypothetical protein
MANTIGRVCVVLDDSLTVQVKIKRQIVIGVKSLFLVILEAFLFTEQFVLLVRSTEEKNSLLVMGLNTGRGSMVFLLQVSVRNQEDHLNSVHPDLRHPPEYQIILTARQA